MLLFKIRFVFHMSIRGSIGKEFACNEGHTGSFPEWGRYPGEGIDKLLQFSFLENPMDRGAWQATVHSVTRNQTLFND